MADKLTSIKGFGEGDPKNDARNKAIHAKMKGKSSIKDTHFGVNPKNNQWEYLGKPPKGGHSTKVK